jgi:hypothetical protein
LRVKILSFFQEAPDAFLEVLTTVRCPQVALSEDRDQAFSIKGALNIFYFLKELCL